MKKNASRIIAIALVLMIIFGITAYALREVIAAAFGFTWEEILNAIDRCAVRLRSNVNFELALELLLSSIKENCNA